MFLCLPEELYILPAFIVRHVHSDITVHILHSLWSNRVSRLSLSASWLVPIYPLGGEEQCRSNALLNDISFCRGSNHSTITTPLPVNHPSILSALVWPGGIRPPCMVTDTWLSHQITSQLTKEKGDHGGPIGTA